VCIEFTACHGCSVFGAIEQAVAAMPPADA
jgi:hypothetical protein